MEEYNFKNFKVANIGTEDHPCVQIHLYAKPGQEAHAIESKATAWGNWVLGPHFKDVEERDNWLKSKELIERTLDGVGQIRFVIDWSHDK